MQTKLVNDNHWQNTAKELILLRFLDSVTTQVFCKMSFEEKCYTLLDEAHKYFESRYEAILKELENERKLNSV